MAGALLVAERDLIAHNYALFGQGQQLKMGDVAAVTSVEDLAVGGAPGDVEVGDVAVPVGEVGARSPKTLRLHRWWDQLKSSLRSSLCPSPVETTRHKQMLLPIYRTKATHL